MNAEIIAIGTELLLGEIVDTNTPRIARALRGIGVDIFRTTTVGDNVDRIAQAVHEATQRAAVVITTGGLGPTVDDPTREGVARALAVQLEFRPELWEQIQERFARYGRAPTENNRRQAFIPTGSQAIDNPVGTAPAFRADSDASVVICLPGVPAEMTALLQDAILPYLRTRFGLGGVIKARVLRTAGAGESWLDERIADLERLGNPTVGLSAHPGQVDIRITAKAESESQADAMIATTEATVRERLAEAVYGTDADTLVGSVMHALRSRGWHISIAESGTAGSLASLLADFPDRFVGSQAQAGDGSAVDLAEAVSQIGERRDAEVGLGVALIPQGDRHILHMLLHTPDDHSETERSYGGPASSAPVWAANMALDLLRRSLA
jgi:nicotinamide-nucleotide amidase